MTKIKGKITKLHCVKTTREWSSDEIFMAVIPVIGKFKDVVIDENLSEIETDKNFILRCL